MGNPFDKIKAENAQIRQSYGGGKTSLNIERFAKSYGSIYDEYADATSKIRSINTADIKKAMEAETKRTENELASKQRKAAAFSMLTQTLTQLPQVITGLAAVLGKTKNVKAGDNSASAQATIQQAEQQLQQAKTQQTNYASQIADAERTKGEQSQIVTTQEAERVKQQGLVDQYKQQEKDLQASLDNGTDSVLASANKDLAPAEKMKTTKTVKDKNGKTKQVEDASLKKQKETAIANAKKKIEDRKTALNAEIAKAKANKEAAQKANAAAIEARDEAQAQVDNLKNQINELTPKKDKLGKEIKQLESEIQRIKGGSTTQTNGQQQTGGSEPSTR